MAVAARGLWPRGRALAWRLGGRPAPGLPAQNRAGFAGATGGPSPATSTHKRSPQLLGAAALALGSALGVYYTSRWHLRAQDLRAELPATQVSLGWTEPGAGQLETAPNFRTSGKRRGQESPPATACDLGQMTCFCLRALSVLICEMGPLLMPANWNSCLCLRVVFLTRLKTFQWEDLEITEKEKKDTFTVYLFPNILSAPSHHPQILWLCMY